MFFDHVNLNPAAAYIQSQRYVVKVMGRNSPVWTGLELPQAEAVCPACHKATKRAGLSSHAAYWNRNRNRNSEAYTQAGRRSHQYRIIDQPSAQSDLVDYHKNNCCM